MKRFSVRFIGIFLCAVLLLGMLPNVFAAPTSNPFTDVKEDAFYYDAVLWAVDKGITTGLSATQFGPNAPCTRGQIVTFLWRAAGSPEPITKEMPFTDVKDGDFFFKAVAWAVEKNITTGLSATQFGANSPCTRGQIVTFLWRFAGEPKPESKTMPFADVKTSDFYFDAVLWAVEKNITTGLSATQFGPNSPCTRGQIVTFLYRNMSTAVVSEPLTILFQPSDFQLGDNLETVEFSVQIKGGTAPYTYQWFICYDDEATPLEPVTDESPIHVVTWIICSAELEAYNNIQFYCVITDGKGNSVQTDRASVLKPAVEPLSLMFQPENHQMESSQESVDFMVQVKGGVAPYTFQWFVCYDHVESSSEPVTSDEPINTLTWEFTDYDFDEYKNIGVYCYVIDAAGTSVQTEFAEVLQYIPQNLSIVSQPNDYRMESSQENAEFTVAVEGGTAPYTYQWVICYDNEEVKPEATTSEEASNTLSYEFSDYDFDDYNAIGVYCIITDSVGRNVETEMAIVHQYVNQ